METTLSASVAGFLRESYVYLGETVPGYLRTLVQEAIADTEALFRDFRWTVRPAEGRATLASRRLLEELRARVCAPAAPLLLAAALPDTTFALGPVWLERWSQVATEEAFRFDALIERHAERKNRLVNGCWRIAATHELPGPLRRTARDVAAILSRRDDLQALDFTVRKDASSSTAWGCLPADYARFCRPASTEDDAQPLRLQDPASWLEVLGRAGAATVAPTALLPVLAYFKSYPFAVLVGRTEAAGLARVFDDRSFMASTELNLLNTLPFASEASASWR